jgi:hypothetical protein
MSWLRALDVCPAHARDTHSHTTEKPSVVREVEPHSRGSRLPGDPHAALPDPRLLPPEEHGIVLFLVRICSSAERARAQGCPYLEATVLERVRPVVHMFGYCPPSASRHVCDSGPD